jgi:hypothetical protein
MLGTLASGERVFDRTGPSHIHRGVTPVLLTEVLSSVSSDGREYIAVAIAFRRKIGLSMCVPTVAGDEIVYAVRENRRGHSRFVKGKRGIPTRFLTVALVWDPRRNGYVLLTAYIGPKAEPEPWDERATSASRKFWLGHALIWSSESVNHGTITTECPW